MSEKITKSQQYALEQIKKDCGNEWFNPYEPTILHYVRRPYYTCQILERKGLLEGRIVAGKKRLFVSKFLVMPEPVREFRLKENGNQ